MDKKTNENAHKHILEDGTVIEHCHEHAHSHTHQNTKAVINRLARAIGHLEKVKRMVDDSLTLAFLEDGQTYLKMLKLRIIQSIIKGVRQN